MVARIEAKILPVSWCSRKAKGAGRAALNEVSAA
jgi:hypothetical protein